MKRLTAIFTALVFITLALAFPIHATNVVVWNSSVEDTLAEIDALHALRNEMILNNEMDDEAFAKIDVRLAEIGVREISQADLMNKLSSCVSTQVTAPPIAGIIWSQYTNVINYFGKMYDIQVVTGDIDRSNVYASPLRSTPSVVCAKQDFQAGSVLGCAVNIGASVVGELSSDTLPAVSAAIAIGQTILDMCEAIDGTLTDEVTQIENASYTYSMTLISTMKYVFIKPMGYADDGNLILGYAGNRTTCELSCTSPSGIILDDEDGDPYEPLLQYSESGKFESKGYNNAHNMAGDTIRKYRDLGYQEHELDNRCFLRTITLNCMIDVDTLQPTSAVSLVVPLYVAW